MVINQESLHDRQAGRFACTFVAVSGGKKGGKKLQMLLVRWWWGGGGGVVSIWGAMRGGVWSGGGGVALTVLGPHCHGSVSHFNEVQ